MAHPSVDATRTVSNHLIEIIEVLGIEAARNALMKVPPLTRLCPVPVGPHKGSILVYTDILRRELNILSSAIAI